MGRTLIQLSFVSWVNLCRCLLIMSLAFSTFPEDWGLQKRCKWYSISRDLDTPWVMPALKAEPMSLWRLCGSPNLGIILWIKILIFDLDNYRNSILCSTHRFSIIPHSRIYIFFFQLKGEKGRASYSWKQNHGPCSAYPSPKGMKETGTIGNSCENSTEFQLQLKEQLK